ncbi:MAG TPA: hypothetical protein VI636_06890 [Candidatus Angelobacter sp.]
MKRIIAAISLFLFLVWTVVFAGATLMQAQERVNAGGDQQQNNLPQQGRDFGPLKVRPLEGALHGDAAAAAQLAPRQALPLVIAPGNSVPLFSSNIPFPFTMVGTDPRIAGAGTTNVTVMIIPLRLNYIDANGNLVASISPSNIGCNDNQSVLARVMNSPLFNPVTWHEGNVIVGVTQFTDAFQRANFWSSVSTVSPNFHVMLNPQVMREVTVPVTPGLGALGNGMCANHPVGTVNLQYLDGVVQSLISALNIPPTVLPLFLTYDIGETTNGCCALGYHTVMAPTPFNPGVFTYAVSSYLDPNANQAFGVPLAVSDISILSHELGEWVDDPLGNNVIAPQWGRVGQIPNSCQNNLEVGDPLTGTNSNVFMANGAVYTVQDLAFFSWFARQNPSIAVNGWYTTLNTFPAFAAACAP